MPHGPPHPYREPRLRGAGRSGTRSLDRSGSSALRAEGDLLNRIKLIWVVQSPLQKFFAFRLTQISCISLAIPAHTKGRFAIVTNVGLGMRWTREALLTSALILRTVKSCGPDAPTLASSREIFAGEGGNKARSPGRARSKPLTPSRAGMPGDPGATVVTNARAYYSSRAAAGASGTRHSPLPSWGSATPSWAKNSCITRAHCVARWRRCVCVPPMPRNAPLSPCGALLIRGPSSARVACAFRLCGAS